MVDSLTLPSNMVIDYSYDGQNRVTGIIEKVNSVSTPLATFGYTYDRSGNTMSATEVINGTTRNLAYTYDNAHRLLTEAINGVTTTFAYDDAGNRISEVTGATSTTLNYNNMNRLTSRVTGTTTITYNYDARGNMTQAQSKTGATTNYTYTYQYNSRDLLTNASTGTTNTYQYDHDGRRTQETANGTVTKFVWDQLSQFGDVVLEQNNTNVTTASYVYAAGRLLSQTKSATLSYLLPDVQGSTRLLINNANSVLQNFDYRAFGEMINAPATPQTRYLYTAQQFDNTTKLYSLRARMYDPSIARFLSMDDYPYNFQNPMELNRYVYAAGNGLRWSDPSGMQSTGEYGLLNQIVSVAKFGLQNYKSEFIKGAIGGVLGYLGGKFVLTGIETALTIVMFRLTSPSDIAKAADVVRMRRWGSTAELIANTLFNGFVGGVSGVISAYTKELFPTFIASNSRFSMTLINLTSSSLLTGGFESFTSYLALLDDGGRGYIKRNRIPELMSDLAITTVTSLASGTFATFLEQAPLFLSPLGLESTANSFARIFVNTVVGELGYIVDQFTGLEEVIRGG
jgi:RHS repeat-associated protein